MQGLGQFDSPLQIQPTSLVNGQQSGTLKVEQNNKLSAKIAAKYGVLLSKSVITI